MIEQIHARRQVDQDDLAREAADVFGPEWVVTGANRMRFSEPVLARFRRSHNGLVQVRVRTWVSLSPESGDGRHEELGAGR
jgi:hypothetical protein